MVAVTPTQIQGEFNTQLGDFVCTAISFSVISTDLTNVSNNSFEAALNAPTVRDDTYFFNPLILPPPDANNFTPWANVIASNSTANNIMLTWVNQQVDVLQMQIDNEAKLNALV
jgi:hypothetical protein